MPAGPCIVVRELTVKIGGEIVLDRVSFVVPKGAITVLIGDKDSGATTAIKAVAGLERAAGGTIKIDGKDVTKARAGRRGVALVFETHALFPHMTIFENVAYPLRVTKVDQASIARRVGEMGELLGFSHVLDRKPRDVPEGLKRRAGLARAIVREPAAYLFDRTLSSLDDDFRGAAREVIDFLRERYHATILMPSNDGAEAMRLADRVVILSAGQVLQEGATADVRAAPANLGIAERLIIPPLSMRDAGISAIGRTGIDVTTATGETFSLSVDVGDAEIGERVSLAVPPDLLKGKEWSALDPIELLVFDSTGRLFPRRSANAQ